MEKMLLKHKKKYYNFLDSKRQMNYFGIGNLQIMPSTKPNVPTTKLLLYLMILLSKQIKFLQPLGATHWKYTECRQYRLLHPICPTYSCRHIRLQLATFWWGRDGGSQTPIVWYRLQCIYFSYFFSQSLFGPLVFGNHTNTTFVGNLNRTFCSFICVDTTHN